MCCSCSPMRHRASTDALWRPLFDREFPAPLDHEQQQQQSTSKPTPPQQQQQQPTGQAEQGHVTAVPVASSTSSSSSVIQQPQQQQGEPSSMHIRLQYLLSHGQRYTLRHSCLHLRQEAGRRGWKWAFGAAWTHRARLLAEAEHNRCATHGHVVWVSSLAIITPGGLVPAGVEILRVWCHVLRMLRCIGCRVTTYKESNASYQAVCKEGGPYSWSTSIELCLTLMWCVSPQLNQLAAPRASLPVTSRRLLFLSLDSCLVLWSALAFAGG